MSSLLHVLDPERHRGYLHRALPNQDDERIGTALEQLQGRGSEVAGAAIAKLTPQHVDVLAVYAERMAMVAVRLRSLEAVRTGLHALGFAIAATDDFREVLPVAALLYRSAERLGADPAKVFREIDWPLARAAEAIVRFPDRTEGDRSLTATGYAEEGEGDLFRYVRASRGVGEVRSSSIETSLEAYEAASALMGARPELSRFAGPRPVSVVEAAEQRLRLKFPPSYRRFLLERGAGSFGSLEMYGVVTSDFERSSVPDGVWYALDLRRTVGLPTSLFPVHERGDGVLDCLDFARPSPTSDDEVAITSYWPGSSEGERPGVAPDFGAFLLRMVRDVLSRQAKH